MNKKELEFILQEGEGLKIEFKENVSRLDKDIVAFSNTIGGRIFLGVNDNSEVIGINITNKFKSDIQNIVRNCDPSIEIRLEKFENILIIEVKEGDDKPYRCKEGFYMRIGANSQKMNRDEIVSLAVDEGRIKFDNQINKKFNFKEDFDENKFLDYIKKAKISSVLDKKNLLESLGVLYEKGMNNAGVLFFAKEPQKFFPQSVYTVVVYRDKEGSDVIDRKEITGNLVEIVEKVIGFVKFYNRVAYKFTGEPAREEIFEYPLEAIREAVINSVMHKDYFETGHNNILAIFPDRIEMEDYWRKPKNFVLGKTKFRRNPIITEMFFRIEFGEKMGSGIRRMEKICKEEGAPFPEIDVEENYFYIAFKPNEKYSELAEEEVKDSGRLVERLVERLGEKLGEKLGENQIKIIELISRNKFISIPELSRKIGISTTAIENNLAKLKQKNILKRVGGAKGGYWEIIKDENGE